MTSTPGKLENVVLATDGRLLVSTEYGTLIIPLTVPLLRWLGTAMLAVADQIEAPLSVNSPSQGRA